MNNKALCSIVSLALALLANSAPAAYNNLSVTTVNTTVTLDPDNPDLVNIPVTIHRVWANFTNPNDALFVWGGGGGLGPCTINNTGPGGVGTGSGFLNDINGGLLPPNQNPAVGARDSYFTIGVTVLNQIPVGQNISLFSIPGNPTDVLGNSINLSTSGGGVTTNPTTGSGAPNPISLAGFTGDGDAALRVLLMQLTVRQGEQVSGTLGITINNGALAGATTTITNQTFPGFLPPPPVCCQPSTCSFVSPTECQALGGVLVPGFLSCSVCSGACCASDGTCAVTTFANCAASGGTFRGYATSCPAMCTPGDINGDNLVNLDDLLAVVTAWGACPVPCPPCAADLNSSCAVDVDDLLYVIQHWLP